MPGLEDDPHAAGGNLFEQLEIAKVGTGLDFTIEMAALERRL